MQKFVCLKETNKCKQPKWKLTEYLLVFFSLPNGLSGNLNITQNSSVFVVVNIFSLNLKSVPSSPSSPYLADCLRLKLGNVAKVSFPWFGFRETV